MVFSFKYFLTLLNTIAVKISIVLIKIYQRLFSPDKSPLFSPFLKGRVCSHEPHCSEYALRALRRYGFVQGRAKAIDRLSRCTATWTKSYDPDHYRVVFFSSAPIGIPFLRELVQDSSMDVVGVVTMPDKPRGRGQKVQPNVIKQEMQTLMQKKSLTPIRKILVLHGFATGPSKCRIPWVKDTFGGHEIEVKTPHLPNPTQPNLSAQLTFLQQHYAGWVDEDTMIVGHSLGGRLAQHFISTLSCRIHTLVCIAPSVPSKHYERLKESDNPIFAQGASYLQGYVQGHPLEKENIKKNVQNHEVWMSEDDPVIPFDAIKTYYDTHFPHATQRIFKDKGHFSTQEKTTSLPELTEIIYQYDDMIKTPTKLHPEKSEKGKSFFTWLTKKNPDYLVVIAYGKIVPQAILDVPKILPVNVHGSLLPAFRGASPIQSVFLEAEDQTQIETGITLIKMTKGMDEGPMIATKAFSVPFAHTSREIIATMQQLGPVFLTKTLKHYPQGDLTLQQQDPQQASYCQKFTKEDGHIDPRNDTLKNIYTTYRAFALWPKIYFMLSNEKRVVVELLELDQKTFFSHQHEPLFSPEQTLHPAVQTITLKPQGKKAMDRESFVNGYLKSKSK